MSAASFIALSTVVACQAFAGPTKPAPKVVSAPQMTQATSKAVGVGNPAEKSTELKLAAVVTKPPPPLSPLMPASADKFCPTEGVVGRAGVGLHVESGAMRGTLSTDRSSSAEVDFTYRGASKDVAPLADGEIRKQIGIKLRAQDSCNVIYAMWHIAPDQGIQVLVKRNPGQSTHEQCKDGGYLVLTNAYTQPVVPIAVGVPHTLRADLEGQRLRVVADGKIAWEGQLPATAAEISGPPGVRSDNGTFDFQFKVPNGATTSPSCK